MQRQRAIIVKAAVLAILKSVFGVRIVVCVKIALLMTQVVQVPMDSFCAKSVLLTTEATVLNAINVILRLEAGVRNVEDVKSALLLVCIVVKKQEK